MIVACQWKRSSPTGPALQFAGGSRPRSCVDNGARYDGARASGGLGGEALSRPRARSVERLRNFPEPRRWRPAAPGAFFSEAALRPIPGGPRQLRQAAARTACQSLVYVAPSPRQRLLARRRVQRLASGPRASFARPIFCSTRRRRIKMAAAEVQTTPVGDLQLLVDSF